MGGHHPPPLKSSTNLSTLLMTSIWMTCRRCRFDPWVGKIPWRGKWQPIPVFFPGESHGQRSLAGYGPWGHRESDTTEWLSAWWITRTTKLSFFFWLSGPLLQGFSMKHRNRTQSHTMDKLHAEGTLDQQTPEGEGYKCWGALPESSFCFLFL